MEVDDSSIPKLEVSYLNSIRLLERLKDKGQGIRSFHFWFRPFLAGGS